MIGPETMSVDRMRVCVRWFGDPQFKRLVVKDQIGNLAPVFTQVVGARGAGCHDIYGVELHSGVPIETPVRIEVEHTWGWLPVSPWVSRSHLFTVEGL